MKKLCLFLFLNLLSVSIFSQNTIPANDAFHFNYYGLEPDSEISAAKLNSPITEKDRISVSKDGHLEANGKRIRIFGTNLSEFPKSHEEAFFYAQSLANQGYNCIRFHHTDASWSNCFLKKEPSGKWVIDKKRLDDFDFFFYLLKENGIYSNINLLTGRSMSSADGYPKEFNKIPWKSQHCYGFWNENGRNHQKQYAFDLLKHVNPYTGLTYAEDPAVAIVEVNNENGFLMAYLTGWIDPYEGNLFQEIEDQWNDWLKSKNLNYSKLSSKYNKTSNSNTPLVTENSKWNLEQHNGAKASASFENNIHTITINNNGSEAWHVQYSTGKLNMNSEEIYTLKFSAKASANCTVNISINQAHDPWHGGGFSENLELSTKWKDYEFKMSNILTDENLRLIFTQMGFLQGKTIYVKDVSLVNGGNIEYVSKGKKSSKTNTTVKFPQFNEYKNLPSDYQNLILSFIWEKENDYWTDMNNYLKKDLGIKALTMGTAMGCSTSYLQNTFDIIDSHAYWNHPVFPETDWDNSNFYVKNKDLTKSVSDNTLFTLAKYRVYGKPFSVSEYDHPYPNQYLSQMYPMIASFASFQDWDCIFTFCSEIPKNEGGKNSKINGFFDQSNNPAKACAAPLASRIFRNFLVTPGSTKVYIPVSLENEKDYLYKNHGWAIGNSEIYGINPTIAYKHQLGIAINNKIPEKGLLFSSAESVEKNPVDFSDTNELYWDTKSGVYMVCNNNVTVSVINKNSNIPDFPKNWLKEGIILPVTNTDDFASFMAIKENEKYLIYACSWIGNTAEELREIGTKATSKKNTIIREEKNLTTEKNRGKAPVLALGINGTFTVYGHKNYELKEVGLNGNSLEKAIKGKIFNLKKNTKTLWYTLE